MKHITFTSLLLLLAAVFSYGQERSGLLNAEDSLAFENAEWQVTDLGKGAEAMYTQVKMFDSMQSICVDEVKHVKTHANMWRTVDDFWDNWSQLNYQFQVCAKWAPHIAPGTWPDADMLPLGRISIRGERGAERWCGFTEDEQYTMMNLWTIFKSPLM